MIYNQGYETNYYRPKKFAENIKKTLLNISPQLISPLHTSKMYPKPRFSGISDIPHYFKVQMKYVSLGHKR